MFGDYSRCKTCQKSAPNGMEMAQKWLILGKKRHFRPYVAQKASDGWYKWIKVWITAEHMWKDYFSCKTRRKNAPNGMEMAQKRPILGKKRNFWP